MYLPVIDAFEHVQKKQELDDFTTSVNNLEDTFAPFMGDVDTKPKQVDQHILDLRERNSSRTSNQPNHNGSNPYDRLQQYIENMKTITTFAESMTNNKDIFNKLYTTYESIHTFYGFEPLFNMAQDYVVNTLQTLTYDSTFFDVESIKNRGNQLPTLYFHTKPDKLAEVTDARKALASIFVQLTPEKENHTVVLEFYNTSLPRSQAIQEKQNEAEALTQFIAAKYSQKTPFWVRLLPKTQHEKWNTFNKRRLNNTYKLMTGLKNDLKTFNRNLNVALQTEDVLETRQAIEDDLRHYVKVINDTLGTALNVEVKYTRI